MSIVPIERCDRYLPTYYANKQQHCDNWLYILFLYIINYQCSNRNWNTTETSGGLQQPRSELYLHNIIYVPRYIYRLRRPSERKAEPTFAPYIIIINTDLWTARTAPCTRVFRTRKYSLPPPLTLAPIWLRDVRRVAVPREIIIIPVHIVLTLSWHRTRA